MRYFLLIAVSVILSACYSSVPMVALMGYDSYGKRERLQKYAESGDMYAMYDLAESYRSHTYEGRTNHEEAFRWYCAAARAGYAKAQYKLGLIYEHKGDLAIEVRLNPARAYMWYTLAARRMNQDAIEALETLKKEVKDKVRAEGEMLLTEWKTVPCGPKDKKN